MRTIDGIYQAMLPEARRLPVNVCKHSSMSGSWVSLSSRHGRKIREIIIHEGDDGRLHLGFQSVEYLAAPGLMIALSNTIPYFPIHLFVKRREAQELTAYGGEVGDAEIVDELRKLVNKHLM